MPSSSQTFFVPLFRRFAIAMALLRPKIERLLEPWKCCLNLPDLPGAVRVNEPTAIIQKILDSRILKPTS